MIKQYKELQSYLKETKEYQVEQFLKDYKIDLNYININNMKDWIRSAKKVRKTLQSA